MPSSKASPQPPVCNLLALRQATRSATALYDRHLAKAGLTTSQHSILTSIDKRPESSMQDLAEALVMDRTTLLRALQPLTREGFVQQYPSPQNARRQMLALTTSGQHKLAEARIHWQQAQDEFEAAFGTDEALALRTLLMHVPRPR